MNYKKIYVIVFSIMIFCAVMYMFYMDTSNPKADIDTEEYTSVEMDVQAGNTNKEKNIDTDGQIKTEQDVLYEKQAYTEQIISDFLRMDADAFPERYDKDDLYQRGILYCGHEAWKYDGNQLDPYQGPGDYCNVENITAIRFYKEQPYPINKARNVGDRMEQDREGISIDYHGDYAVSTYSKAVDNGSVCIQELSFIKIETLSDAQTAPENLYYYIETDYYEVRESLAYETWMA